MTIHDELEKAYDRGKRVGYTQGYEGGVKDGYEDGFEQGYRIGQEDYDEFGECDDTCTGCLTDPEETTQE